MAELNERRETDKQQAALEQPAAVAAKAEQAQGAQAVSDECQEVQGKLKAARDKLRQYKLVPEDLRSTLFQQFGGFEAAVAEVEREISLLGAERRGTLPLKDQVDSATAHEKATAKQLAAGNEKLSEFRQQQEDLARRLAEQEAAVHKQREKHESAKSQLSELTARLSEAKRDEAVGSNAGASQPVATFAPGAALWSSVGNLVRFAACPEVIAALGVAGMAKEEFEILSAEIQTVHAAAAQMHKMASDSLPAAASAALPAAGAEMESEEFEMELDDDEAERLAEAVADLNEEDGVQARAAKVAAAKAKIKTSWKGGVVKKMVKPKGGKQSS